MESSGFYKRRELTLADAKVVAAPAGRAAMREMQALVLAERRALAVIGSRPVRCGMFRHRIAMLICDNRSCRCCSDIGDTASK